VLWVLLGVAASPALFAPGPAGAAGDSLAGVTVTGAAGSKPSVSFPTPFTSAKTVHPEGPPGAGRALGKGARITFDYSVFDGRTGKEIGASFGPQPASMVLDSSQYVPALVRSLVGARVGARTLIAVASKEGLAKSVKTAGVKPSDTLLYV